MTSTESAICWPPARPLAVAVVGRSILERLNAAANRPSGPTAVSFGAMNGGRRSPGDGPRPSDLARATSPTRSPARARGGASPRPPGGRSLRSASPGPRRPRREGTQGPTSAIHAATLNRSRDSRADDRSGVKGPPRRLRRGSERGGGTARDGPTRPSTSPTRRSSVDSGASRTVSGPPSTPDEVVSRPDVHAPVSQPRCDSNPSITPGSPIGPGLLPSGSSVGASRGRPRSR